MPTARATTRARKKTKSLDSIIIADYRSDGYNRQAGKGPDTGSYSLTHPQTQNVTRECLCRKHTGCPQSRGNELPSVTRPPRPTPQDPEAATERGSFYRKHSGFPRSRSDESPGSVVFDDLRWRRRERAHSSAALRPRQNAIPATANSLPFYRPPRQRSLHQNYSLSLLDRDTR